MDKHSIRSGSFIGRHRWRTSHESPRSSFSSRFHQKSVVVPDSESSDDPNDSVPDDVDPDQILAELDGFTDELSTADDKTNPPDLPDVVDTFSTIIKSKTRKSSARSHNCDTTDDEDVTFLLDSVRLLCNLKTALGEYPHSSSADKIGKLLHRVMVFMEQELRGLLVDLKSPPEQKVLKLISYSKHFSFKTDRCPVPELSNEDDYPGFTEDKVKKMNKIVSTMISSGYKNECSSVYCMARGNALYEQLKRLDFEKLNAEDVQRLNWDSLESDVSRWIRIIRHCSHFLIPAERKLGETVFSDDHLYIFKGVFVNVIRSVVTSLLDYAAAVANAKRSAERLFKFLDMHKALHGLIESMNDSDSEYSCNDLNAEILAVTDRIGEGAVCVFGDLENSIRNDAAKTPVPGGAVHPLTRHVLNYLKHACEYGDMLEEIFQQNAKLNQPSTDDHELPENIKMDMDMDMADMDKSPLAVQIMSVMIYLHGNLAVKSTLYKDLSLRNVFLMNNGRYILQKVKGSIEMKKMMGENWCRRRSSEVRNYHKSYQRETWARLLQCLTQEGIHVNGKVSKKVLKERFKNFNAMFDEIHKTQSSWVVSEEQLLSELRVSISALVIPAYRSFLGRYKHHFEGGKSMYKYIKYQAEDIESLIETLFEGNPSASMSRRRF